MDSVLLYGSTVVSIFAVVAYVAVIVLRTRGFLTRPEAEKIEEIIDELEGLIDRKTDDKPDPEPESKAVPVMDPSIGAPRPVEAPPTPEVVKPKPGTYTVVYWSDDRTEFRYKSVRADSPSEARQFADDHEAEYCANTGAPRYSFSRIDYPEE